MDCFSYDMCVYHFWFACVFPLGIVPLQSLAGRPGGLVVTLEYY